ncbi:hypothetical protein EDC01DRAFT_414389 [Geopyxis carbonaria]|nr:hypothetical protein EDC01DRAFT_414389 [Geopyxis carbonaria]
MKFLPTLASSLLRQDIIVKASASTSSYTIDEEILSGGLRYGEVVSISGLTPYFRTVVAMHVYVMHLLSRPNVEATWIDATGNFSPHLLQEIVENLLHKLPGMNADNPSQLNVMERAKVCRVFDMDGLLDAVNEFSEHDRKLHIGNDGFGGHGNVEGTCARLDAAEVHTSGLVIIDNIPLPGIIAQNSTSGNHIELLCYKKLIPIDKSLLATFQQTISQISHKYNTLALILNETLPANIRSNTSNIKSVFESVNYRPAFGPTFAYGIDLQLHLSQHSHAVDNAFESKSAKLFAKPQQDIVMEVLVDRFGARTGSWGAFRISGSEILEIF